jgi:hypothetical protein
MTVPSERRWPYAGLERHVHRTPAPVRRSLAHVHTNRPRSASMI